uniref:Zgc:171844 n=1 Tax=Salarias fasciatus TaxID=181472 RepID=A0A672GWD9_SALFA
MHTGVNECFQSSWGATGLRAFNVSLLQKKGSLSGCCKASAIFRKWKRAEDVVSMADSTITVEDIEGELFRIERIRDILVRRESELRYMMDDIQLCKEITRLKQELQKLVSVPDKEKSKEDREKEEELLQQINKLVETRDFLVEDVEFERLREREEDREMAAFLQSKFQKAPKDRTVASASQQTSAPFITKTGLALLKDCCGFTCSVM